MNTFPGESPETDQLLRQARNGDERAFDQLFSAEKAALRRFIHFRLDARISSRVDASDIVQETHYKAFRRFNDYFDNRPMPFAVWLKKNALDLLLNARRRHVDALARSVDREQPRANQSSIMIADRLPSDIDTPSEQVAREEYRLRVAQLVDELPEHDRELLLMRTVEGHSHKEIAKLLDIGEPAARKRYVRALVRLEQLLVRAGLTD